MFDRLLKALRLPKPAETAPASQIDYTPVSQWAGQQGFRSTRGQGGNTVSVDGKIGGKSWRVEVGAPSRGYIQGEEIRGRADLGLHDEIAVLVMNRPLKDALERKAYTMITDGTHTTAEPNLPEEMRWLAMYEEVGWDGLPPDFWRRYAVLTSRREHAVAWLEPYFVEQLLNWPMPAPGAEVPFIAILVRGKVYMRMQFTPAAMPTFTHATEVFTAACEAAMGGFS